MPPARPRATTAQFKDVKFHGDEITYVSLGEGTTSEGEFWEALNTAANSRLPLIFVVEDNGYAISVPVEVQTAGGNISRLVSGFPNFHFEEVDGTDPGGQLCGIYALGGAQPRRAWSCFRSCPRDPPLFALAFRR